METFTPSTWTGKRASTDNAKLPLNGNAPFYLLHHPNQWELVQLESGKWRWLPTFGQLHEIAGVNGIEDTRQGPDSTVARMKLQERGQLVLDREFGYVSRYETKGGGYYYTLRWDIPKIIGNKVYWNTDTDGYNLWRLELMEIGVIKNPEIEIVQEKISMIDRKIDRRMKLQHIPEIKKEIDELYALKKQMDDAYKSIHSDDDSDTDAKTTKKGTKK